MPIYYNNNDDTQKCIHVHIPKTGGKSIATSLQQYFKEMKHPHIDAHSTVLEYKNFLESKDNKTSDSFQNFLSFSVIRNPYDHMVSVFHYGKLKNNSNINKYNTFYEFVNGLHNDLKETNEEYLFFGGKFKNNIPRIDASQSAFITDENNNLLIDEVIRFENLNENIKPLFKKLDIKINNFPHLGKVKRESESYNQYYNHTSKDIVEYYYKRDFDNFNYKF